jgi:hypothetical protein
MRDANGNSAQHPASATVRALWMIMLAALFEHALDLLVGTNPLLTPPARRGGEECGKRRRRCLSALLRIWSCSSQP